MAHNDTWDQWEAKLRNSPLGKANPHMSTLADSFKAIFDRDQLSAPTVIKRVPNPAMNGFRVSASHHEMEADNEN